jgi:3-dehydroquinate dehydratase-1
MPTQYLPSALSRIGQSPSPWRTVLPMPLGARRLFIEVAPLPSYKPIALNGQPVANGKFPLICVPLVGSTLSEILAELDMVLPKKPDVLEWRVDFFEQIANTALVISVAEAIKHAADGLPLLFTRRSIIEGGERIALNEDQVIALYAEVCKSKHIDLIDYEMANETANIVRVREIAHAHGIKLILSFHNFDCTPPLDSLVAKFMTAEQLGADIAKVAVMPSNPDDALTLLSATREASWKLHIPLISMAMGSYGSLTRLFGWAYGSALTFAMGARSSAPGQIAIEDMNTVLKIMQKSMNQEAALR